VHEGCPLIIMHGLPFEHDTKLHVVPPDTHEYGQGGLKHVVRRHCCPTLQLDSVEQSATVGGGVGDVGGGGGAAVGATQLAQAICVILE
jgi:hypothetical protein